MKESKQVRDAFLTGLVLSAREELLKEIEVHTPWTGDIFVKDSHDELWYTVKEIRSGGQMTICYRDSDIPVQEIADILSFDQLYQIAIAL